MKKAVAGLVVLIVMAGAATAMADRYQANSTDGTKVQLRTNAAGKAKKILFGHYQANCDRGYTRIVKPISGFKPPFDTRTRQEVLDRGHDKSTTTLDGVKGTVTIHYSWYFVANRKPGDRWRGKFRTAGRYTKHGKTITRCAAHFGFNLKRK